MLNSQCDYLPNQIDVDGLLLAFPEKKHSFLQS